jgi:hypothetical protein
LRRTREQGARLRTERSHVTVKPASQAECVHVVKSWLDQQRFARIHEAVAKLFERGQPGELAMGADARPPLLLFALFALALESVQALRPEAGAQVSRKLSRPCVCVSVQLWPSPDPDSGTSPYVIPVGCWAHSAAKDAGVPYPSDEWGRLVL